MGYGISTIPVSRRYSVYHDRFWLKSSTEPSTTSHLRVINNRGSHVLKRLFDSIGIYIINPPCTGSCNIVACD